jgi:hypothetical protein
MEGRECGLIEILTRNLRGGLKEFTRSFRVGSVTPGSRYKKVPNKNLGPASS